MTQHHKKRSSKETRQIVVCLAAIIQCSHRTFCQLNIYNICHVIKTYSPLSKSITTRLMLPSFFISSLLFVSVSRKPCINTPSVIKQKSIHKTIKATHSLEASKRTIKATHSLDYEAAKQVMIGMKWSTRIGYRDSVLLALMKVDLIR